jgi:flagellar FliL protein
MENLVLNPAESGGSRFLLFSLAFELRDQAAHDAMKARDAEMRDVVLAALGRRTTEQLADMALRDSLKAEVGAAAARQLGKRGGRAARVLPAVRHPVSPRSVPRRPPHA